MLEEFSSSKNVVETNLILNSNKSASNETVVKQQSTPKTLSSKFNATKPNGYNNKTASVGNATRSSSSKTSTKKANTTNNNNNTSSTTSINNAHQKLNTSSSSPSDQDQNQHLQYNLLQQQPSSLMYSFVTFEGNKKIFLT